MIAFEFVISWNIFQLVVQNYASFAGKLHIVYMSVTASTSDLETEDYKMEEKDDMIIQSCEDILQKRDLDDIIFHGEGWLASDR